VAECIKNKDFIGAMELRDPEFEEYHRAYMATTKPDDLSEKAPEDKVGCFGITCQVFFLLLMESRE